MVNWRLDLLREPRIGSLDERDPSTWSFKCDNDVKKRCLAQRCFLVVLPKICFHLGCERPSKLFKVGLKEFPMNFGRLSEKTQRKCVEAW